MEYDVLQERYFEALDALQALLELITRRENEVNALYARVEILEAELEKRNKIITILKGGMNRKNNKQNTHINTQEPRGNGPLALLVDPIPRMRLILKEIIISAGFVVIGEAADLKTAVSMTAHGKPDLVIINSKLGPDSGLDALKKMREIVPELKAILITDGYDPTAVVSALEQGVADIIPKPINRLRLHELAVSLAEK